MDKDPSSWASIVAAAHAAYTGMTNSPTAQGVLTAVVVGALRSLYGGERRWLRVTLEGVLCGALTTPATSATAWALASLAPAWTGPADSLPTIVGGAIGFIGVMQLRKLAMAKLKLEPADVA